MFKKAARVLASITVMIFFVQIVVCENPKYEIRAIWLTTNYGLDWPESRAVSEKDTQKQKESLCQLLDMAVDMNINTVFFQARVRSDVLYKSAYEPYNAVITGTRGKSPLYDPLAFAIEECHKRGLQCHAWLVCMNIGKDASIKNQGKSSLPSRSPNMCILYKGEWYLNPGVPETKDYLVNIVKEVIENYDVDGIHLDYIRYPDRSSDFPDKSLYKKYAKGGQTLANWRIENINKIVYAIFDSVKEHNPKIQVSSAVIGKRDRIRSFSSFGWSGIEATYQDVAQWLKVGKQDFIAPMMYYPGRSFYPFLKDWIKNSNGYPVVTGLGAYRLLKSEGNWSISDFMNQIYISRQMGAAGAAFYRTKQLEENTKGVYISIKGDAYNTPALYPPLKNSLGKPLQPPTYLNVSCNEPMQTLVTWKKPYGAKYCTLYASDTYPVNTSLASNIVAPRITEESYKTRLNGFYYAVTATDAFYRESDATQQTRPFLHFKEGDDILIPPAILEGSRKVLLSTPLYVGSNAIECLNGISPALKRGVYTLIVVYENREDKYPLIIN